MAITTAAMVAVPAVVDVEALASAASTLMDHHTTDLALALVPSVVALITTTARRRLLPLVALMDPMALAFPSTSRL